MFSAAYLRPSLNAVGTLGGRVLSIHSRQAVNDVLAVLDRHARFGTAVMHWFTGTVKELELRKAWLLVQHRAGGIASR